MQKENFLCKITVNTSDLREKLYIFSSVETDTCPQLWVNSKYVL